MIGKLQMQLPELCVNMYNNIGSYLTLVILNLCEKIINVPMSHAFSYFVSFLKFGMAQIAEILP